MSEIDRIFARLGGSRRAESEQSELRSIARKGNAAGRRVVEVVRLPPKSGLPGGDAPRRTDSAVRAQTWDNGFPAKSAPPPIPAPAEPVVEAPKPVAHFMPVREVPAPDVPSSDAAPILAEPPARAVARPARRTAGRRADVSDRRFADPFDPEDDGANCMRCGYVIEPAREQRGLLTCAQCG